MRLLILLPILLLALVAQAQPICQINDLITAVTATDPANCKFSIKLDFKHQGTTNQFTVQGNGNNYGTFTYDQLPVTLGPIMGQANVPTVRELVVNDVLLDCKAETVVTLPACSASGQCNIRELTAVPGDCIPGTNTFPLTIDFAVDNPGNLFFEAWTSGGTYLGIFPIAQLPVTLPAFPAAAGGTVKVCINDHPDCCETAKFTVPNCGSNCGIFDLKVETGDCTSDTTFNVKLNFAHNLPLPGGLFNVTANGNLIGTFNISQLPLAIPNFPWNGQAFNTIQVCLVNSGGIIPCCLEAEFLAPKCIKYQGCEMSRIKLETGDCTSDSTFKVTINFLVADTSVVDSFMVWADGISLGTFGLNQLPLMIPNYPWKKGTIFSTLRICTGNSPLCCRERQFVVPKCLPFGDCKVEDIKVLVGACNLDGSFKAVVNFQATNPGNGTFTIAGNGQVLGTFPFGAVPLTIANFPSNGAAIDVVRICINPADPNTQPCCESKEFEGPVCEAKTCEISGLKVEVGDCQPNGTYKATINFTVENPPSQKFILAANGQTLGVFELSQLPLMLTTFPSNGAAGDIIRVCMVANTPVSVPCCAEIEFEGPSCAPCEVYNLKVEVGECTSDSTYKATIKFDVQSPPSDKFVLFVNGHNLGTFDISQLPLTLSNFPSNGTAIDVVKVCMITAAGAPDCCRSIEFQGPACGGGICEIYDLKVEAGPCTSDSTYKLVINFQVQNPGGTQFGVWANGGFLGTYNLNQLPLTIPDFPWNGGVNDVVKVCMMSSGAANCCRTLEFKVPDCLNHPCGIVELSVTPDGCTSDSTFRVKINFGVVGSASNTFTVWGNGQNLGNYTLSQLPLVLTNFPSNGTTIDVIKICLIGADPSQAPCCTSKEFQGPACNNQICEIYDLKVEAGPCTSDSTYKLVINFQVQSPGGTQFGLWGNGIFIGNYNLNQLPLTIPNFLWNGGANDVVKVCMSNSVTTCCRTIEYKVPDCLNHQACEIVDLSVVTDGCTSDSTYRVKINFGVVGSQATTFGLWGNGIFIGNYNLSQLPLTIPNFLWDGGLFDVIKVCVGTTVGGTTCCKTTEYHVPECLNAQPCEIYDFKLETGACTSDSSYKVKINFQVSNPMTTLFSVVANGQFFGFFNLNQLPLTIDFPWNGGANDVIKVCVVTQPGVECCKQLEFKVPDCLTNPVCEIYDLTVVTGDCTSDSTYNIKIDFEVSGSTSTTFGVWGNNVFIGNYNLNQLPLTLPNFLWNGGANDVIKVCMVTPNGPTSCCRIKEFAVPACLHQCEIYDFQFSTGDCTSDSTYEVKLNFKVSNVSVGTFGVWANGQNIGYFNLNQLPLAIHNFPSNGGVNDVIKVCLIGNNIGTVLCCHTQEFPVPDCIDLNCHIWDLNVIKTACLCGQFFAVLTFKHENGDAGGFDILGNGQNYGNFPYNHPQPIILGPLVGDGTKSYEFVVKDHSLGDCKDVHELGKVECATPTDELGGGGGSLALSPNPATDRLAIAARLDGVASIGQAQVDVHHADGRLVQTLIVNDGGNFQLDVSTLPAGVYRLTLMTEKGRLEASFVKQ